MKERASKKGDARLPRRSRALLAMCLISGLSEARQARGAEPFIPEVYRSEISNQYARWTEEKAKLGRALFFEKRLSVDRSVSCATCHAPEHAFADRRPLAVGLQGRKGSKNAPTLVNRVLGESQFWDGRAATLEAQAVGPIQNAVEMGLELSEAVARLRGDAVYRRAFQRAFGAPPSPGTLAEALAAYERTIYSFDSPFDRFIAGDARALSPSAQRGLALFGQEAGCGRCHSGINFTDESFHVLGVSDAEGRAAVTGDPADRGAMKTPTLREIARTAPYMHDGSLATLEEVIDFYDSGCRPHPNLDSAIRPLTLTPSDKADLVAFLHSLSGRVVEGTTSKRRP